MGAQDHLSEQFGYRGGHQPNWKEAPGAHEMESMYPDYYSHPEYYHSITHDQDANRAHRQTISALKSVRGNPEAQMHMYRAVPHGVTQINQGDWVTPSEQYARIHAMQSENPHEDWPVLRAKVPAKHLRATGDYAPEFGYSGPSTKAEVVK